VHNNEQLGIRKRSRWHGLENLFLVIRADAMGQSRVFERFAHTQVATLSFSAAPGTPRRESRKRPGGNVTGSTFLVPEVNAKRLEIFKEPFPRTGHMAVLVNPNNPAMGPIIQAMKRTAKSLKMELQQFLALGQDDLDHGPLSVTLGSIYSDRSPPFKYVP